MVQTASQLHGGDLAVMAATPADESAAAALATRLQLSLHATGVDVRKLDRPELLLIVSDKPLAIQQSGRGAPGPVSVDFGAGGMRHRRRAGHNELLGKAIGVNRSPALVIDATAGLGRDAFVLADLGCPIILCEREPVVAELLSAGLKSASSSEDSWLQTVAARMSLYHTDARLLPAEILDRADVIYLDPMFPGRDKSAAVKKEMALFQRLVADPTNGQDAEDLLHWALAQDVARVVVKRPLRAEPLGGAGPSHSLSGKAVRFDVYSRRRL